MSAAGFLVGAAEATLDAEDRARITDLADAEHINPRILATLAHTPGRLERFKTFYENVVAQSFPDGRLKAVIRDRVAELDPSVRACRLPREAEQLDVPESLAADELALIRFIDEFTIDHLGVSDEVFGALHAEFSDGELVELLWTFAVVRALARVGAVVGEPLEA